MSHQHDGAQTALEAVALTKSCEGREVLCGLNLQIAKGETHAIMGANGAGKTTLLRCLAGIMRPDEGFVRWMGKSLLDAAEMRRCVGLATHESQLYADLTIYENLLFAARMCDLRRPRDAVRRWLEQLDLHRAASLTPARVSHGMRRRAAIARSMIHEPPIMLLDEPFSGLDDASGQRLLEILSELRSQGGCVCFATHDKQLAATAADVIVRLENGQAVKTAVESGAATPTGSDLRAA